MIYNRIISFHCSGILSVFGVFVVTILILGGITISVYFREVNKYDQVISELMVMKYGMKYGMKNTEIEKYVASLSNDDYYELGEYLIVMSNNKRCYKYDKRGNQILSTETITSHSGAYYKNIQITEYTYDKYHNILSKKYKWYDYDKTSKYKSPEEIELDNGFKFSEFTIDYMYTYNEAGLVEKFIDTDGIEHEFKYKDGKLTSKSLSNGETIEFSYLNNKIYEEKVFLDNMVLGKIIKYNYYDNDYLVKKIFSPANDNLGWSVDDLDILKSTSTVTIYEEILTPQILKNIIEYSKSYTNNHLSIYIMGAYILDDWTFEEENNVIKSYYSTNYDISVMVTY